MKSKNLLLTLALSLSTSILFAQGFQLGIKGGADIQKISGVSFNEEFAYGYHLGGFAQISINKKLSIQPELYYSAASMNKASNFDTLYTSVDPKKIKFGYINIPILLNIKPGKKLAIQVGPQYGILSNTNLSVKANAENAFKKGDFSMLAGFQLYFNKIRVYGRYQIGLTNINDASSQEKWKSQTVHLGVGLRII